MQFLLTRIYNFSVIQNKRVEWADSTKNTQNNDQMEVDLWQPITATENATLVYRFECVISTV